MEEAQKAAPKAHDALLSESFISGRRAGLAGYSSSLYELQPGTSEYNEFMRGFRSGADERAAQVSRMCRYNQQQVCNCSGRGLCLDVA